MGNEVVERTKCWRYEETYELSNGGSRKIMTTVVLAASTKGCRQITDYISITLVLIIIISH